MDPDDLTHNILSLHMKDETSNSMLMISRGLVPPFKSVSLSPSFSFSLSPSLYLSRFSCPYFFLTYFSQSTL